MSSPVSSIDDDAVKLDGKRKVTRRAVSISYLDRMKAPA
jgi:hypothetical protein